MSRLDEISQYINQLPFDLKAEMLVAVMAEQRLDLGEVLAAFDGQLKRTWSRDIAWSSVDQFETGDHMLSLHLNRDGVYDTLPEVLFHGNYGNEDQSAEEMAKDTMKLRVEEKEARSFFQPFENEIFLQRVQVSIIENQLFNSISSESLMAMVPDFWRIEGDLPYNYVVRLKKLLPLVNRVTGDVSLTAQCLEFILKEKVRITYSPEFSDDPTLADFNYSGVVGASLLGINTISGNLDNDFIDRLVFTIGPILHTETNDCVKNGSMNRFLDCFYSYFVPFELDTETKFIFSTEQSMFTLHEKSAAAMSYLGYNSVIQ